MKESNSYDRVRVGQLSLPQKSFQGMRGHRRQTLQEKISLQREIFGCSQDSAEISGELE